MTAYEAYRAWARKEIDAHITTGRILQQDRADLIAALRECESVLNAVGAYPHNLLMWDRGWMRTRNNVSALLARLDGKEW